MSQGSSMEVLLLDEDQSFARRLKDRLRERGIDLHWRNSLFELVSVGKLGDYDLVLVEPFIGPVNGLEIAEYAETLFPGLPVLLVGNRELPVSRWLWPRAVVGFARKEPDLESVVAAIMQHGIVRSERYRCPKPAQHPRYASA